MKGVGTCCKIEYAILKHMHIFWGSFCGLGTRKIFTMKSEKIWHTEFTGKKDAGFLHKNKSHSVTNSPSICFRNT